MPLLDFLSIGYRFHEVASRGRTWGEALSTAALPPAARSLDLPLFLALSPSASGGPSSTTSTGHSPISPTLSVAPLVEILLVNNVAAFVLIASNHPF